MGDSGLECRQAPFFGRRVESSSKVYFRVEQSLEALDTGLSAELLMPIRISHLLFNGLQKVSGKQGGRTSFGNDRAKAATNFSVLRSAS